MQINVLEYLEQGALARFKTRPAVEHDGQALTFEELARLSRRCGCLIVSQTEATNRPIAVYLPKSSETIIADLGILYSGNCYSNLDVKSPRDRTRKILEKLRPALVITSDAFAPELHHLDVLPEEILSIHAIYSTHEPANGGEIERRRERAIDTDPVCIINTSGSTGIPKSVVMNHRSIIDFIDWVLDRFDFDENETIGSLSPFQFDIYTLELYVALARGAKIALIPDGQAAFPATLLEFLSSHAVTFIFWVPSVMVNIAALGLLETAGLSKLRKVFFAGEVFPTRAFNVWRRNLPHATFVNLYGPIEITVDCTYYVVDRDFADDEPLPIGAPCRNTDILILDEANNPTKVNEVGELCVRGSSLAMGYWNSPDKTGGSFVQNPINSSYPEPIYRTGDLVFRNDRGELMFVGRKDYQIKHLGYRIELGEIEHAVTSIDNIDSACVLYDAPRKHITLFFTSKERLTAAGIRRALSDKLPKYMLPTVCLQLDVMPRNPNGKIDRRGLAIEFMETEHADSPGPTNREEHGTDGL